MGKARSRMNALRHGSSSRILIERNFITRHLNARLAETLHAKLEPVRRERIALLSVLDAAISSGKVPALMTGELTVWDSLAIVEFLADAHPELPWKEIAGFRDVLMHDYDDIRLDVVWRVATVSAPMLLAWIDAHGGQQSG